LDFEFDIDDPPRVREAKNRGVLRIPHHGHYPHKILKSQILHKIGLVINLPAGLRVVQDSRSEQ
jgi:hypothetical protein